MRFLKIKKIDNDNEIKKIIGFIKNKFPMIFNSYEIIKNEDSLNDIKNNDYSLLPQFKGHNFILFLYTENKMKKSLLIKKNFLEIYEVILELLFLCDKSFVFDMKQDDKNFKNFCLHINRSNKNNIYSGTIFEGKINFNKFYFNIHDIHYFYGINTSSYPYKKKYEIFNTYFKQMNKIIKFFNINFDVFEKILHNNNFDFDIHELNEKNINDFFSVNKIFSNFIKIVANKNVNYFKISLNKIFNFDEIFNFIEKFGNNENVNGIIFYPKFNKKIYILKCENFENKNEYKNVKYNITNVVENREYDDLNVYKINKIKKYIYKIDNSDNLLNIDSIHNEKLMNKLFDEKKNQDILCIKNDNLIEPCI